MIDEKFDCEPQSVVGPLKISRLRKQEDLCEAKFDSDFIDYTRRNHGGIPKRQWVTTKKGTVLRVGRFINFGGPYQKPFQENWLNPPEDLRDNWEIGMVSSDGNFDEGCGEFLMPIALLFSDESHPDGMTTKYLDAICFDFSGNGSPKVVYWNNRLAGLEYSRCENLDLDTFSELNHENFTEPIARDFETFVRSMRLRKPKKRG